MSLSYAIYKNSRLAIYLDAKAFWKKKKKKKVFLRPWGGKIFLREVTK